MSLVQLTHKDLEVLLEKAALRGAQKALATIRIPNDSWISITEAKRQLTVKGYGTLYRLLTIGAIRDNGKERSARRFSQKSIDQYLNLKPR